MFHDLLLLLELWKLLTLLQGRLVQFLELFKVRNSWTLRCLCSTHLRDNALGVFNNFINSNLWLSSRALTRFCIPAIKEKIRGFFLTLKLIINQLLQIFGLWWANVSKPLSLSMWIMEPCSLIESSIHELSFRYSPTLKIVWVCAVTHCSSLFVNFHCQVVDFILQGLLSLLFEIFPLVIVELFPNAVDFVADCLARSNFLFDNLWGIKHSPADWDVLTLIVLLQAVLCWILVELVAWQLSSMEPRLFSVSKLLVVQCFTIISLTSIAVNKYVGAHLILFYNLIIFKL